jgi:hypothetical protein
MIPPWLLLVVLSSLPAHADPLFPAGGLTVTECPPSLATPLPELLALELVGVVDLDPTKAPALAVRCTDATVIASATLAGRTLDRRFDRAQLSDAGSARLLALTLAELRTAVMEKPIAVESPPSPAPPPTPSAPPPTTVSQTTGPPQGRSQSALAVSTRGRGFADGLWLWGPQLQVDIAPCGECVLRWTMGGEWSQSRGFRNGDVDSALFSTAVGFGYRADLGRWTVSGLAGLRMGSGAFTVQPRPGVIGADHQGLWGGPAASLDVVFALSPRWAIHFDLESGYTLWSVKALIEGQDTLSLAGAWISPAIGLRFAFSDP